jgi:hypothetical protein
MREFNVSVGVDHIQAISRARKPLLGIAELIWNALDADATRVRVVITPNELKGVETVLVEDNGTGILPSELETAFGQLGDSWKRLANETKGLHRALHGKKGVGRYRAFALGDIVSWDIHKLRREAMTFVRQDDLLRKRFELLVSIPGIAQVSAMQLLAELSTLPPDLTVREWVAHSGLDPAHEISGSSVRRASRISHSGNRHLRRALYMPALVASRCDPYAKAFFDSLLARNKARLQALIAVARKLLHAIYGIFRSGQEYEGTKLFPMVTLF